MMTTAEQHRRYLRMRMAANARVTITTDKMEVVGYVGRVTTNTVEVTDADGTLHNFALEVVESVR